MELSEVLLKIFGGGFGIAIVLMTLIQIAPIKINPWSWITKKIGSAINKETINKINSIDGKIDIMERKFEDREMMQNRMRIIIFNDEIYRGVLHSREHFIQIMNCIDEYEEYCAKHDDFKNNQGQLAIENVKDTYVKCDKEGSFL